ncbi:hypothetical protein M409DRAFT_57292 [Zasmidium cellare ATCC 36951]|uniref:NmrA-like domain-containing protein n=1 Tax=Zasmidium cellare ATCC 36951 TaxID=1080233 RepID=A0A6A6C9W5_ZASCE|nr:uncharacterized protein M409DRAFT_57292 [Zasmidium cellare ATCC 36951]KAF2163815.1 hypothetical protein M409DRAFT_57292 [Zasmidium cellare ATCC 36951]
MHTVGILGINGNLGKPTAQHLVKAAEQDKIKLVIFHREGKAGDFKPGKNVELRVIDLDGPTDKLEEAVKGVNVFVSTVGVGGLMSEGVVMEAISKSPDFVTYMPAMYSTTWSKEDFEDPVLGPVVGSLPGYTKPKELGIGITKVYTGIFDFTFFESGFLYASLKDNSIYLNDKLSKSPLPITTMPHLAQAIAQIVTTNSPEAIKNKSYSVITLWATGAEIRDLYTKLHGKPTQVNEWTPEEREVRRHDKTDFTGAVRVGYVDKWEGSKWEYETDGKVLVQGHEGVGLEEVAKGFL